MAQAAITAPSKAKKITIMGEEVIEDSKEHLALALAEEFDPLKKYMFQSANENIERELPIYELRGTRSYPIPHKKFKPYQNVIFTSQIIWNKTRRMIRYYAGCDTIFADKQPKDKDLIDQYKSQTEPLRLLEGKFGIMGVEKMQLLYCNICAWNARSPFRAQNADAIFVPINPDEQVSNELSRLDEIDNARDLAKNAPEKKMLIHAAYLGIPTTDWDSGNELTPAEIRVEYRKAAIRDAKNFTESYGNKKLEIKYYIDQALKDGLISNKSNPNKATWAKSNSEICDISGLKSPEAIADKLFEYSETPEGEEFVIQLKALYD